MGLSSEEEMEIAQNMPTYSNWEQLVAKRSSSDLEECSVRGIYLELLIKKLKVRGNDNYRIALEMNQVHGLFFKTFTFATVFVNVRDYCFCRWRWRKWNLV